MGDKKILNQGFLKIINLNSIKKILISIKNGLQYI